MSDTAQVLQAQLADVGIRANVNVAEFGAFVQDWTNSNFDMFVSLNGGSVDPDGYLHRTFITGGSTNVFKYSDPEVDEWLEAGRTTTDPAARYDKSTPIYGMPIIDADKAHMCFCIKRSMNPGFAGIENELYYADRTFMLFGDAKQVVGELGKQLAGNSGIH